MDKVKVIINLSGMALHMADLFTDFAITNLYFQNCEYKFFFISIGIFVYSYIMTVIYLRYLMFKKESFKMACLYPYHVLRILFQKLMISLNSKFLP